jgi:competence protein ComEC
MKKNSVFVIFGILVGLNILAWIAVYDLSRPQSLEVTFFDIGQGDSILIETPQRHQILIDGGPDSTVLEKLGREMPFWDNTLDLVILTHPEHDHYGGLFDILRRYKVENILWTGVQRDTVEYQEWKKLIEEEKAKVFLAQAGQKITSSKTTIQIFFPLENLNGKEVKNVNNTSVVAKLSFNETSFLFTGDIYKSAEKELIARGFEIDSDILKVSHHGSKTSSDEDFIREVSPEIAIISCGQDNPYGHPYPETLETLEKRGVTVLRTDLHGDIKILSTHHGAYLLQY